MRTLTTLLLPLLLWLGGCESTYYAAMEKVGLEKRDILVDRVEDARDAQEDAQEQFTTALERYSALVDFDGGELQDVYENLNDEYEASEAAAERVRGRIDAIEDVAGDLFDEWEDELAQYSSASLRRDSEAKLRDTRRRYEQLIAAMRRAETRMDPVLDALRDNVLYLKHNLNARAIASLDDTVLELEGEVDLLIEEMNASIAEANAFIESMNAG